MNTFRAFGVCFGLIATLLLTAPIAEAADVCQRAMDAAKLPLYPSPAEYRAYVTATEHAFNTCRSTSTPLDLRVESARRWAGVVANQDPRRAEALYRQIIQDIRNEKGPETELIMPILDSLSTALMHEHQGPVEEMLTLATERLRIARKIFGEQSQQAAESLLFVGRYHEITGNFRLAETYYRDAMTTARTSCPTSKCRTLSLAYRMLGEMLASDPSRLDEADQLKQAADDASPDIL